MRATIFPRAENTYFQEQQWCIGISGVPQNGRKSFPGDVARFEFEPEGDVIDKFVLKKERFEKPYSLE